MSRRKDVLTTGEVAKLCNVAPRTVSKWFDSGSLKGYRIPGSRDRRMHAGFVGNIAFDKARLRAQLRSQRRAFLFVDVGNNDVRAFACQSSPRVRIQYSC